MVEYYNGEEVVEFVSKCPVDDCTNTKDNHWKCSRCSVKEYINSEGYIICTQCKQKCGFYEEKFNCGLHETNKPPSRNPQRLIAAFAMLEDYKIQEEKSFVKNC